METNPIGYISKTGVEGITPLVGPQDGGLSRKDQELGACNNNRSAFIFSLKPSFPFLNTSSKEYSKLLEKGLFNDMGFLEFKMIEKSFLQIVNAD
jgi:hypothetical protein